ncbi:MAG: subtype B tannase [Eubacterium sp.]
MDFNAENYCVEKIKCKDEIFRYRAFRNIIYVQNPVDEKYQQMNIFAPEAYYDEKTINGYDLSSAPIFMPNYVGGYMPGDLKEPGINKLKSKDGNIILQALKRGYVVAVPAIRGRSLTDRNGNFTGKAPACIIDYKAAVRFIRYFSNKIPGNSRKIITNGTSAGGALSALMGATGNHIDYQPYLDKIGALDSDDCVFAVSAYCPITNLDNADMAYEWQFCGVNEYRTINFNRKHIGLKSIKNTLTETQIKASEYLKRQFSDYVNSLNLFDDNEKALTLNSDGNGRFREYIKSIVVSSANKAIDIGEAVDKRWIITENGRATDIDFDGYVRDITRMKPVPAFDGFDMNTPENDLFGTKTIKRCHFTEFSYKNSTAGGLSADKQIIKMMNPMNYIDDTASDKARFWRIRHGECDRDTSLAISAILNLKLKANGFDVDYFSPWNVPHSGDYDLNELFDWIDSICKLND